MWQGLNNLFLVCTNTAVAQIQSFVFHKIYWSTIASPCAPGVTWPPLQVGGRQRPVSGAQPPRAGRPAPAQLQPPPQRGHRARRVRRRPRGGLVQVRPPRSNRAVNGASWNLQCREKVHMKAFSFLKVSTRAFTIRNSVFDILMALFKDLC